MVNRLIKTETDYEQALSRIEELMDADAGTPEADELELLATLVEMYEDAHYPIDMPNPVDAIRFRMEQAGLKQQDLVPYMGSRSKVSEVLNRKRPLTLSMMRGLHRGLGVPAEVLLQASGAEFPRSLPEIDWNQFPVVKMAKRGWIPNTKNIREKAEELMRDFIEKAGGLNAVPRFQLRQSVQGRVNAKTDPYALYAWCLRLMALANENPVEIAFNKKSLTKSVLRDVARLSYFENGPRLAREYLNKQGIHFFVVPHLPKTYVDGGAMLSPDGRAIIGMTLRYDREDNFWFCLLHELAHLSRHLTPDCQVIIDDLEMRKNEIDASDALEKEADEIASDALIPKKYQAELLSESIPPKESILELAEKLKVSPAIIAGRIRFNRNNYRILHHLIGQDSIRHLFPEYGEEDC